MAEPPVWGSRTFLGVSYACLFGPGGFLQRLFSMFPNAWPGTGLLLLWLVTGSLLIHDGIAALMGASQHESVAPQVIAAIAGIFLLAGLWTPIAGGLLAIAELWIVVTGTPHPRAAILLVTIGVVIAALGPGAWSIDARLFGRQRLDI
jgi:putative oxidoreductase